MKFNVSLRRRRIYFDTATVTVEAEDDEEAIEIAEGMAFEGSVQWTEEEPNERDPPDIDADIEWGDSP